MGVPLENCAGGLVLLCALDALLQCRGGVGVALVYARLSGAEILSARQYSGTLPWLVHTAWFTWLSCISHTILIAFASVGWASMQRGQNILTPQSIQVVHPARSKVLSVWPMIAQSFPVPVIEYAALALCVELFLRLRRRVVVSPHSVCAIVYPLSERPA